MWGVAGFVRPAARTASRHGPLHHRLVEVVAVADAGVRVHVERRRREHPLPRPLGRGVDVLLGERVRQRRSAPAAREVGVVQTADPMQVARQPVARRGGEHGDAVFPALAAPDPDLVAVEVDVLDAEGEALEQAQAGPVQQQAHEARYAAQAREHRPDLGPAQDDRQALGRLGAGNAVEHVDVATVDAREEEHERAQGLLLGRGADALGDGEEREEDLDVVRTERGGVPQAGAVPHEAADPVDVGGLGAGAVVQDAQRLANAFEDLTRRAGRRSGGRCVGPGSDIGARSKSVASATAPPHRGGVSAWSGVAWRRTSGRA